VVHLAVRQLPMDAGQRNEKPCCASSRVDATRQFITRFGQAAATSANIYLCIGHWLLREPRRRSAHGISGAPGNDFLARLCRSGELRPKVRNGWEREQLSSGSDHIEPGWWCAAPHHVAVSPGPGGKLGTGRPMDIRVALQDVIGLILFAPGFILIYMARLNVVSPTPVAIGNSPEVLGQ